ncbi:MAG: UDP-glucose 4-epimerase GalE [Candidatus Gracilibacteria bacterium]|nr:UDP-glucose 4-epimerase GalE [Candidatus Gracilibacteria bacterium]
MKTILITGGTGYIGSHAVVAFEQAGYKTVIVDNLSNSSLKTIDGIEKIIGYRPDFFEVDLRDKTKLEDVFRKYDFDGVVHFAGLKAVGESCEKPLEYFDNNIVGSIRLFELMKDYGVRNIIFSSSATVYTSPQPSPLKEREQAQSGIKEDFVTGNTSNPYGTTKFLLEVILTDLSKFAGFNVINLRYFNPIGAHESGYIGEDPDGIPNNLLPYIMKVATGELKKLRVFGDDYDTVDGTGVRDYIDVVDLIDGHLKAYELLENIPLSNFPPEGERIATKGFIDNFNLGVGRGVSVLEMVEAAKKVTGKDITYEIAPRREGDLGEVYCNPSKAKSILDWEATTSLEDSLRNSWKFYNK